MFNFTDLTGLASVASASTAAVLLMPGIANITKPRLRVLLGSVFMLMLIPFGELSIAAYLRGAIGDLSITTLVLVWCALLKPWFGCGTDDIKTRRALLILVALVALMFYPLALGMTAFDPYRLGYGDMKFVAELLLVALAAWLWKYDLIASCIAFAALAWAVGWYESGNLWDYLLDPWISIYALCVIALHGMKALLQRCKRHESRL